jgi:hypothetical protein
VPVARRRNTPETTMRPGKRLRDLAVILPLGGIILLLPPYVRIFDQPLFLAGIPLLYIYIFAVWLTGIVLTGLVARHLVRSIDVAAPFGAPFEPPVQRPDDSVDIDAETGKAVAGETGEDGR